MINIEQLWRDYSKYEEVSTWIMMMDVILIQGFGSGSNLSNAGKTVE